MRWREEESRRAVFEELAEVIGEDVEYVETKAAAERLRAMLLHLHREAQAVAGPFELPEATDADNELAASRVPWEDIREKPAEAYEHRRWMREPEHAELEAAEAEWAESLR